jgi:CMP-N,N'-diacetyllegionaminic acid synthase
MDILCIIPARGGSRSVKNKNIRKISGKPLIGYTIEAALQSRLVNKIVVSTDDPAIAKVANGYHIEVIKRPKSMSTDTAPIEWALRHAVNYCMKKDNLMVDIVVWLQANVPIRKKGQIDHVITELIRKRAHSAATVFEVDQIPQWMYSIGRNGFLSPLYLRSNKYRRQDIKPLYLVDGAIVAIKREILMGTSQKMGIHMFMGKKKLGVIEDKVYALEIDEPEDLKLAEFFLKYKKNK